MVEPDPRIAISSCNQASDLSLVYLNFRTKTSCLGYAKYWMATKRNASLLAHMFDKTFKIT